VDHEKAFEKDETAIFATASSITVVYCFVLARDLHKQNRIQLESDYTVPLLFYYCAYSNTNRAGLQGGGHPQTPLQEGTAEAGEDRLQEGCCKGWGLRLDARSTQLKRRACFLLYYLQLCLY
jgi:hypothetical protein